MGKRYAVVGSGRQGVAAAYDLGKYGDADELRLLDHAREPARAGAARVNRLLGRELATAAVANAADPEEISHALRGVDAFVAATPYPFNLGLTEVAIRLRANMCDMGADTGAVRKQLLLHQRAQEARVTIVPDCGMDPGMSINMGTYAMTRLDDPRELYIWGGGLPQKPRPPWNYALTFSIGGLTNEYHGYACFLRDGKVTEVPCLEEVETLTFPPPLGELEAFVTSGGLSTAPWTFEGMIDRLENKTLRYPGHVAKLKAFAELGLFSEEPVKLGEGTAVPRELFHALFEPKILDPDVKDVCVIRVRCVGKKEGRDAAITLELIDYYDDETGFTAMERLSGWHASIMTIQAAHGLLPRGVIPVELSLPGKVIIHEAERRGWKIEERMDEP